MDITNKDETVQYGQGRSPTASRGGWDRYRWLLIGLVTALLFVCWGAYLIGNRH